MCGIAGIILKKRNTLPLAETVLQMSEAIRHRGPDGEGLIAITNETVLPLRTKNTPSYKNNRSHYIPQNGFVNEVENTIAVFAHRRLAILDLSENGHQPMCDQLANYWITFNGEIYNYKELKAELITEGYQFISESDTEVVINAYKKWGVNCIDRFNGMWAFCLYDKQNQLYFASRDRLGVKPFYYINSTDYFAFASEQKAFIKGGLLQARFNEKTAHDYLTNDLLENNSSNFFEGINELWPGENLLFNLSNNSISIQSYFKPTDLIGHSNDSSSDDELILKFKEKLNNAIAIRMRSDVEVGTCLSGGIDSSAIAGTMSKNNTQPIHCFTSVFKQGATNEEHFADSVAQRIHANHHKTQPTFDEFEKDLHDLIYALDAPIWDTSTYAQFRVMQLSKENNIKVVLDGQGADELFAGYHHHFISMWEQSYAEKGSIKTLALINEAKKVFPSPLLFYFKQQIKKNFPLTKHHHLSILKPSFINSNELVNTNDFIPNVNEQLLHDMGAVRLKSFLRCEDRCGMWHSVESRTPFSDDIELMSLAFSFNGNRKIKNGVSKYFLREAAKDVLPDQIYNRYDKVGFETPTHNWVEQLKPKITEVLSEANFDFVDTSQLKKYMNNTRISYSKMAFKLYVLATWKKVFQTT